MTAPELKPCPFCGGGASISKDHDPDGNGAFYAVKCRKCRAKSPEIYAVETCNIHFAQVRDAWNRRADIAATQPMQVHPDPRAEVIARLVEALRLMRSTYPYNPPCYGWVEQVEAHKTAKAALAAAKEMMK